MVEFVLLYALGFMSALLLGLFIAPAIHGRIVRFTEKRLRATVPLSASELKAARDMDRAAHAVENRRIDMELHVEREKWVYENKRAERLQHAAATMRGEIETLVQQIDAMSIEAADMRSEIRQRDQRADALKLALSDAERVTADRERHAIELQQDLRRLSIDLEDMKIGMATRETEAESLRCSLETANEERRRLREQSKALEARTKDAEYRLVREEERSVALEQKLAEAVSKLTDQESTLERRNAEIARLKDKVKALNGSLRAGEATLRPFGTAGAKDGNGEDNVTATTIDANGNDTIDRAAISQRVEKLRARHTALVDRLVAANDTSNDQALRSEIKEIAASMVSLTAAREGSQSPIHAILASEEAAGRVDGGEPSIAVRASALMREKQS